MKLKLFPQETNIDQKSYEEAEDKFIRLMIDLSLRDDNKVVGSGLGGNENQFLTLSSFNHLLSPRNIEIEMTDQDIIWGKEFLNKDIKDVRKVLDEVFISISQVAANKAVSSQLKEANELCSELAKELDLGITTNIEKTGEIIKTFSPMIILYAVRKYISIQRLVNFELDVKWDWLKKINSYVC